VFSVRYNVHHRRVILFVPYYNVNTRVKFIISAVENVTYISCLCLLWPLSLRQQYAIASLRIEVSQHAAIKQKIKYGRMVQVHRYFKAITFYNLTLFACAQACTAVALLRTQLLVNTPHHAL
jgi:hypothetical protein